MGHRVNYSGLVIAGIGFFLTRFTVSLALYDDPVRFYLAGVVPLVLGLGLAAFGVALTVANVESTLVRTTAVWCLIGVGGMFVFVLLTLFGSTGGPIPNLETIRSQASLSNFLIGGAIGGTLTGLYAARSRQQREALRQQADRLEVLNGLLRHEVLNALTAIRGYASIKDTSVADSRDVIDRHTNSIEETITEIKYLTGSESVVDATSVESCLTASIQTIRDEHPDASITVDVEDTLVRASDRLERVFTHLVQNAVVHATGSDPSVDVTTTVTTTDVRVAISDNGPGLPEVQQRLLEDGDTGAADGPGSGFGLNIVYFLVQSFDGAIETAVDRTGTTITVVLPRSDPAHVGPNPATLRGVRPALPHLVVTLAAAILAGIPYGVVVELLGSSVSGIGVFYGQQDPVVGWITHEFHSVVFGFVFAGLVSLAPARFHDSSVVYMGLGTAWALTLWFFAAGFIAPVWLQLLGIPAAIPTFRPTLLASHLAWGVSIGLLTNVGYRYLAPRLRRLAL